MNRKQYVHVEGTQAIARMRFGTRGLWRECEVTDANGRRYRVTLSGADRKAFDPENYSLEVLTRTTMRRADGSPVMSFRMLPETATRVAAALIEAHAHAFSINRAAHDREAARAALADRRDSIERAALRSAYALADRKGDVPAFNVGDPATFIDYSEERRPCEVRKVYLSSGPEFTRHMYAVRFADGRECIAPAFHMAPAAPFVISPRQIAARGAIVARWTATADELIAMLCDGATKLPRDAVAPRWIQGHIVYAMSRDDADALGDFHRVRIVCDECGAHVPAGRALQHAKAHEAATHVPHCARFSR